MPRIVAPLASAKVDKLSRQPGAHAVGGAVGLYLHVMPSVAKEPGKPAASWQLRYTLKTTGRREKLGLGSYPTVKLETARKRAQELAELVALGGDPKAERRTARSAALAEKQAALTFKEAATLCIEKESHAWKNPKSFEQWTNSLETYAFPVLGKMLIEHITMAHVLKALEPIWTTKPETASRVRMRIEKVIAFADARAHRQRPNPARWKHNLDTQLAKADKVKTVRNHPALAIDDIPAFMSELRGMEGSGARALELAILCAARSGEVRGATWSEFDLDAGLWVIPAARMKADKEHRVPLSADAEALLRKLPRLAKKQAGAELLFPSAKGTPLSDMTLAACIKRLNEKHEAPRWIDPRTGDEATPHGTARSTFRDWVAERTHFPGDMAEMALAHTLSSAVEAAYRRGDMVEKRRKMMETWATFCRTPRASRSNVVPMAKTGH